MQIGTQKGIFFSQLQEAVVLEKLLWSDIYKADASMFYKSNVELQQRADAAVKELAREKALRNDAIELADSLAIDNSELYRENQALKAEATILTKENKALSKKNLGLTLGMIGFGISTTYLILKPVINIQ